MKKFMVILLGVLSGGILIAQDLTVDEIVSKYLHAIGQDKMETIQTIVMTGKSSGSGMEVSVVNTQKRPDLIREEADLQGTKIIFAGNPRSGWMVNPLTGSPVPQDMNAEFLAYGIKEYQFRPFANWDNPFVNWKENGSKVELIGREDLKGIQVYNLQVTFKDSEIVNYYLDVNKFIVLKIKSKAKIGGQVFDSEDNFSDYRYINGILVSFKSESTLNGQPDETEIIEKCEFNLPADDSLFQKPSAGRK